LSKYFTKNAFILYYALCRNSVSTRPRAVLRAARRYPAHLTKSAFSAVFITQIYKLYFAPYIAHLTQFYSPCNTVFICVSFALFFELCRKLYLMKVSASVADSAKITANGTLSQ
jgi:hypothetical protein